MATQNGKKPRFNHEQYGLLKRCSETKDMSEWNHWRISNSDVAIELEGADLIGAYLLMADLHGALLNMAKLSGADLTRADLAKSELKNTECTSAIFVEANLNQAILCSSKLEKASFIRANMRGVNLYGCHLEEADFYESYLEGARIQAAFIQGVRFKCASVDGVTLIIGCQFDGKTDFTGVGLDSVRIEPEVREALKDNNRHIKWRHWCEDGKTCCEKLYRKVVHLFWMLTDYGSSTKRIIWSFFILATIFGILYWLLAMIPGSRSVVEALRTVDGQPPFGWLHTLVRSLYFSVVTMTTLGFGDMHAATSGGWESYVGYFLLSFQVILGYVLLGALVTRLGILFTSEAPAAEPTPIGGRDRNGD